MKNQVIRFSAPGVAELIDIEVPTVTETEVLVKIEVSSVSSGTERANITGELNVNSKKPKPETACFPRYGGYSSAGEVIAVGAKVEGFAVGDRVTLSWSRHQRYIAMDPKNLCKIEDNGISYNEAALLHIATFPLAAVRKCRLEIGESAVVMGLGVLGMLAVQQLRLCGAVPIVAVDPVEKKRRQALEFGADHAFDPFAPDFAEQVKKATGGGANVGIEVTGNGAGLNGILDCMAMMGRVALLGCTRDPDFTVDYYRKVHGAGVSLIGAHTDARPKIESAAGYWTTHDDICAMLKLISGGRLQLRNMIEEIHSPTEAPEIYTRLAAGGAFPLVQFDWSDME